MNKVKLYTNDGRFVVEVTVPPWKHPVELYLWGERFFIRREDGRYTEAAGAFACVLDHLDQGEAEGKVLKLPGQVDPTPVEPLSPATGQDWSDKPKTTTDGEPPADGCWDGPAPKPVREDGQHGAYYVLPEDERAKGFVRPYRRTYVHAGPRGPKHPLRDLTDEERARYATVGYVKFEAYGEDESPRTGRYWTQADLDRAARGCGVATTMGKEIAETYARDPSYYGKTFCCGCKEHYQVGARDQGGEFFWDGSGPAVVVGKPDYDDPSYEWVGT